MLEEKLDIKNLIYEIRGKRVMLDSNLAKLYQSKNGTKTINQIIKRNFERFPNNFYFQLTKEEYNILKSQIGTSSLNNYGASFKDLGKKCFEISKIEEDEILIKLLNMIGG